jgi:hypothetical protein
MSEKKSMLIDCRGDVLEGKMVLEYPLKSWTVRLNQCPQNWGNSNVQKWSIKA